MVLRTLRWIALVSVLSVTAALAVHDSDRPTLSDAERAARAAKDFPGWAPGGPGFRSTRVRR